MKNEKITERDKDFAKWYTDVVKAAHLTTYSSVKGCIIFEPNGYALWEEIQKNLDRMFKETGHRNVYMPLLIPKSLLEKEGELVEGFAPEVAWVTKGGQKELEEPLCVRPTSETLFSDYYHEVVKSYRDLPLKYNQWCSVFRWEKETRPFLRSREFLWQEGHTVHETSEEAEEETKRMLGIYEKLFKEYLAIPVITGKKTEKEKFAGAEYSLTVEALMYNGVALQSGTSHYFGDKFAKAYDITFKDRNNKDSYCYQTSWGVTTRMIGALIMVHSDDFGLVLPPKIAPVKVAIIKIGDSDKVNTKIDEIVDALKAKEISYMVDDSEKSPGFKFAEAEVNGIPVRIEVGERDLNANKIVLARRDTREKITCEADSDIASTVSDLLDTIQKDMYQRALERREKLTFEAHNLDDVRKIMDTQPGFIKAMWCGDEACELKMKEIKGTKSRCILEDEKKIDDKCVVCGKDAKHLVVWGIQY
ncbi:MAG: proline--tRNA ligase [Bacilli bacterium]|jgi:prolyl-tRNA synthetase|nr:proline--tRNA ligase [Bacilli bacterium]